MPIILLTACINPGDMPQTFLKDNNERLRQYRHALDFYLNKTNYPILFVENSGTDISEPYCSYIESGRLEVLFFYGNQEKKKGKGYGEAKILEYALYNSSFIKDESIIIKITGRLIVENINEIINHRFPFQKDNSIVCSFNSDCKFADSRIFCAPTSFLKSFVKHKNEIDDSNNIYFEHILSQQALGNNESVYPFWVEPSILGVSGSTGRVYYGKETTTKHSRQYRIYVLEQALYLGSRYKKKNILIQTVYQILHLLYKVIIFI